MKTVQYTLVLNWKSFSVDLPAIEALVRGLEPSCSGSSADDNKFSLHFTDIPSTDLIFQIQDHWDTLTASSQEALSYKSKAQMKAEKDAANATALASVNTKLTALGLTPAEIAAIVGS